MYFYLPESDTAAVYSAVKRTEDVSYGQIVVKSNKRRGTAALLSLFLNFEQSQANCFPLLTVFMLS